MIFHNKNKFKQYIFINYVLQKVLKRKPKAKTLTGPTKTQATDNPHKHISKKGNTQILLKKGTEPHG